MSPQDLSQLVNFCSGRLRLPPSAADFPMAFKLTLPPPKSSDRPDDYLPIAQTCFFSLSLPRYSSTAVSRLWRSVDSSLCSVLFSSSSLSVPPATFVSACVYACHYISPCSYRTITRQHTYMHTHHIFPCQVCLEKLVYAIWNTNLMDADFAMRDATGWENVR
jgi:hypothetical protein